MAVSQGKDGKPIYALEAFLRAQKVELPKIRSIELLDTDRVVLSLRPDQLQRPLEFETIQDNSVTHLFRVSKIDGESQIEASIGVIAPGMVRFTAPFRPSTNEALEALRLAPAALG